MPDTDLLRMSPNIVLLAGDPRWHTDASAQATSLGLAPIRTVHTPQEAMTLLARGFPPVSHVLLQPEQAGDLLDELVDMTAGQRANIALVVLGSPHALPHHPAAAAMTFIDAPGHGWLQHALADDAAERYSTSDTAAPSVAELHDALAEGRFQTRYQPIVRFDTGAPVGLEVLARLDHPTRGVLHPDLFVPRIEEQGLAWKLTQAIVTSAFSDWGHGRLGSFGLTLAINFPLDVLLIPEALTWLESRRREAGLPAERVIVELTESKPVSELVRLRHAISTLRGIGYGLAIDDVGPELRDHRALLDLQFTAIKLDKDLVQESPISAPSHTFLSTTIAAARDAGLTIIAEGVEDAEIWNRMRTLGVDEAQGFYVARPLPAAAVPVWHHDWTRTGAPRV